MLDTGWTTAARASVMILRRGHRCLGCDNIAKAARGKHPRRRSARARLGVSVRRLPRPGRAPPPRPAGESQPLQAR
jgi:hypothetical protein